MVTRLADDLRPVTRLAEDLRPVTRLAEALRAVARPAESLPTVTRRGRSPRCWMLVALPLGLGLMLSGTPASAAPTDTAFAAAQVARAPIAVVVHDGVPVQGLTLSALRSVILGNQRFWSGAMRIEVLIDAGPTPARRTFVQQLSGMSEVQFQQYWIGQVFRGRATHAPRAVPDRATALALLVAIPGSIALIEVGDLPPGVRALPIDGLTPGATGYPLVGDHR